MKKFFSIILIAILAFAVSISAFAAETTSPDDEVLSSGSGYLPPDEFFAAYSEDDYTVSTVSLQSSPNTPVSSASGLKGILLDLFGSYDPPITQLRYQANSTGNYTYVNDIQPDYPWLCAAGIFAIVLFCIFKMGGAFLCRK